jgi:hypothetical protein
MTILLRRGLIRPVIFIPRKLQPAKAVRYVTRLREASWSAALLLSTRVRGPLIGRICLSSLYFVPDWFFNPSTFLISFSRAASMAFTPG